ncbi:MAG: SEL1-like repeat protein [Sphingobacteriales bacterium]
MGNRLVAWDVPVGQWGAKMTSVEIAAGAAGPTSAEDCFGLGMVYSAGAGVPVDLVQAHKWFNIAAMRGHQDAAQLRREIAEQMSDSEIGHAQRAARDWLKAHPQTPAPAAAIRVAA